MSTSVKPIPDGFHTVTPYLMIKNASQAILFYQKAFGATLKLCMKRPEGDILHGEIKIGDSVIMFSEECAEMNALSPETIGHTPVSILLYVNDVDTVFEQAVAAGAEIIKPVENQFFGDRMGTLKDPFGHVWSISTHVEDVDEAELNRRFESMLQQYKDQCKK